MESERKVREISGEGISVTDLGIFRLTARETDSKEVHKISRDPAEMNEISWPEAEDEARMNVGFWEASWEELQAYMREKNEEFVGALADARHEEPSGKGLLVVL